MKRREFITILGSATAIWPALARSQPGDRIRRIAVLMPFSGNDEFWHGYLAAFNERLQALGWTEGRNVRFDNRLVSERTQDIRMIIGKWMEVLKQLAPGIRRVGVIYDPQIASDQVRVRHQRQNRQGAGAQHPAIRAVAYGRSD
jgi:hypothetical protein